MHRFEFHSRDLDASTRIKCCRANLGDRGNRWDFTGGLTLVVISIKSAADAEQYDKTWRFWNVLKGNSKTETHRIS